MHRREQEFRALAENNPDMVARYNRELRYIYVNPAMEKNTGIPRELFIGRTNEELNISTEQARLWRSTLLDVLQSGQEKEIYCEDNSTAILIVGGHSSGGGLAIRFGGSKYGNQADAYILLSPYLKYNAPTMRKNSGGWAYPYTTRIAGLTMLNNVGIHLFDHLPVIQFKRETSELITTPLKKTPACHRQAKP